MLENFLIIATFAIIIWKLYPTHIEPFIKPQKTGYNEGLHIEHHRVYPKTGHVTRL